MLQSEKLYSGRSLHIGLNRVNPNAYNGWYGFLTGCVNDANAMLAIAQAQGYESTLLLDEQATRDNVLTWLDNAAEDLYPGDVVLLTYSGHGGRIPDESADEEDYYDETWCLFDGQVMDDTLYEKFCEFAEYMRLIVVSDSCHSGTVIRSATSRGMPTAIVRPAYLAQKDYYDSLKRLGREKYGNLQASVGLLSGCQDNQYSFDGANHGLFTEKLLEVWRDGAFVGDYWNFNAEILKRMPDSQSPGLLFVGYKNLHFEWSKPFTIR